MSLQDRLFSHLCVRRLSFPYIPVFVRKCDYGVIQEQAKCAHYQKKKKALDQDMIYSSKRSER